MGKGEFQVNALDKKIRKLWNNGRTLAEMIEQSPEFTEQQVTTVHQDLESRFGCASLPMWMLYGDTPFRKHETSDEYKLWKGEIGPGKELREIIQKHNDEMMPDQRYAVMHICKRGTRSMIGDAWVDDYHVDTHTVEDDYDTAVEVSKNLGLAYVAPFDEHRWHIPMSINTCGLHILR
jgi:hypothetical protein